jgi:hypothetical protein
MTISELHADAQTLEHLLPRTDIPHDGLDWLWLDTEFEDLVARAVAKVDEDSAYLGQYPRGSQKWQMPSIGGTKTIAGSLIKSGPSFPLWRQLMSNCRKRQRSSGAASMTR